MIATGAGEIRPYFLEFMKINRYFCVALTNEIPNFVLVSCIARQYWLLALCSLVVW